MASQPSEHDPLSKFGANEWLVDEMYERYLSDPDSVDKAWLAFFREYRPDANGGAAGATSPPTQAVSTKATPATPSTPAKQPSPAKPAQNAVVASGIAAKEWARCFDTVSICFSKGLGAPVGSALVGPRDLIKQARRLRKALGGGWRQAGLLAAAASYALDHHIERLADDHANAQILADAIRQSDSLKLVPTQVETNIVIFEIDPRLGTAAEFCKMLGEQGVGMFPFGKYRVRAVTHLDVTAEQVTQAAEILLELSE